jgi:hypothetical protein
MTAAPPPWREFLSAMQRQQYFDAHEHLELLWRSGKSPRLQAAIWCAVLLQHQARGNRVGVLRVREKLLARLQAERAPAAVRAAAAHDPADPAAVAEALQASAAWFLDGAGMGQADANR